MEQTLLKYLFSIKSYSSKKQVWDNDVLPHQLPRVLSHSLFGRKSIVRAMHLAFASDKANPSDATRVSIG